MTENIVIMRWREHKYEYTASPEQIVRNMKRNSGEEHLTNKDYMREVARRSLVMGIHLLFADEQTFLEAMNEAKLANVEVVGNES